METKPSLPKKLPLEARKKLSVTSLVESATHSYDENGDEDDYLYSSYLSPFEPQIDRTQVKVNDTRNDLEFFNDSIYFTNDDYSSLALYTSSEPIQKPKNRPKKETKLNINHNLGQYLIDTNESNCPKPAIPPKRQLSEKLGKLSLANDCFSNVEVNKSQVVNYEDEVVTYIQPTDKKAFTFDDFKSEIFSSRENRMCADCKSSDELPTWISCVYFMLYCDYCAEIHLKLSHAIRPFYMIELDQMYQALMDSEFFCDAQSFIYMIREQAGNEKINSLLEFQLNASSDYSREKFIKEKYLSKAYANQSEFMSNAEELNRSLMNYCVVGPCLPITIFNIFMGANVNSISKNRRSVLDNACDFNQKHQITYLKFQGALTYDQIVSKTLKPEEFVGELTQIIDLNNRDLSRSKIMLKLCNDNKMLIVYLNRQTQLIFLNTVIQVNNIAGDNLIEIKWLNMVDIGRSTTTYIEFYNGYEKHQWMRELCAKMSGRMLSPDDEALRIDSMAYFDEMKFDKSSERCLVVLFEARFRRSFKKKLVVFYRDSKVEVDVRKLVRIRLDDELLVIDVLPTRSFKIRSSSNDIGLFHQHLKSFTQLKFASIDEQFLNKDSCPLIIDKLCSFVEIFYLTERSFYGELSTFENKSRLKSLFTRLESERDLSLNKKLLNSNSVLTLFRIYFGKYIRQKEIELIKTGNLKSSPILFTTLKRLTSHLVLISRYEELNHHSIEYLSHLFSHLISPDSGLNLSYYLSNYEEVFGLSEEYFKLQTNIVDKLAAMKSANKSMTPSKPLVNELTRLSCYLTNIYLTSKSSGRFFQISISQTTKPKDILKQAIAEFSLTDKAAELSLFEVIDAQFCYLTQQDCDGQNGQNEILLERVLPVNTPIVNHCHDWCKFNFVVKSNYFNPENLNCSASFHDVCLSSNLILKNMNSGKSSYFHEASNKKWRNSYLSVQNACIRVTERQKSSSKESSSSIGGEEEDENIWSSNNIEMKKLFEAKVEECLVYYGLYEDGGSDYSSPSALDSTSSQSTTSLESPVRSASFIIRRLLSPHVTQHANNVVFKENCLTFYHLAENTALSVCLDSRSNALKRYACLFKLAHYPDTWSI